MKLRLALFIVLALAMFPPLMAQTFVYSGREYLKQGRSWFQIRQMDLVTGRRGQLTSGEHDHFHPWCSPDNHSILFTPDSLGGEKRLSIFDRQFRTERLVARLAG